MTTELIIGADGCTLDEEGMLWIADVIGGRVLRVREGGEIAAEIKLQQSVFACMLGGAQGNTLFMCEGVPAHQQTTANARASRVSAIDLAVRHAGRP